MDRKNTSGDSRFAPIRSSDKAFYRFMRLKNVWSNESIVQDLTMVYIAELLERQNDLLSKLSAVTVNRKWWEFWK